MKYTELKASLKNKPQNSYLIFGEDRYLCFDALKKIEESANINIKDMNIDIISGEKTSAKDIVASANIYPFGDEYRLVVVKNYNPTKNKEDFDLIQNYLNNQLSSTILVFFNPDNFDFFSKMNNLVQVDCNKIDLKFIYSFIANNFAKREIKYDDAAIEKLALFCNSDMSRIVNEVEKLCSYLADGGVLTADIVEEVVSQDKEFQVFQLAEFLAKGDAKNALDLVESFSFKPGSAFTIMTPLYNNYRRALFVALNKDKSAGELANLLSVKEYAIKVMQNQIKVFTPKKLKKIVSMIVEFDEKIKTGEIKENVAIKMLVFNILYIRGQNE